MKKSTAFWAGVIGALMMTVAAALARAVGIVVNLEMTLGSMVTQTATAGTWVLGLGMHLLVGGLFGLLYGLLFEKTMHHAGAWNGVGLGIVHGIVAGLAFGVLPPLHPAMPETVAAPGMFFISYGFGAALVFLALHVGYGAIVGAAYAPVLHPVPRPVQRPVHVQA